MAIISVGSCKYGQNFSCCYLLGIATLWHSLDYEGNEGFCPVQPYKRSLTGKWPASCRAWFSVPAHNVATVDRVTRRNLRRQLRRDIKKCFVIKTIHSCFFFFLFYDISNIFYKITSLYIYYCLLIHYFQYNSILDEINVCMKLLSCKL